MQQEKLHNVIDAFCFDGECVNIKPITQGYINATYCLTFELKGNQTKRYILQSINTNIFHNPQQLMYNVEKITSHIKAKLIKRGGNPQREVLNIIPLKQGGSLYHDTDNRYWRAYLYIEDATAFDQITDSILFERCGKAFGKFQKQLSDFDANSLYEIIEGFHNTPRRYQHFCDIMRDDPVNRVNDVITEIQFIKEREKELSVIMDLMKNGSIPVRVTHNDTKLNNIMMDNQTGEGICVLDLDTVMPGCGLFDFGDSIRNGASTASEDEPDLSKVMLDMTLFKAYTKGFLSETKEILNKTEIKHLVFATKIITLEQAIRFLGDYINGDTYYRIERPQHNLDRARTQIQLVKEMEAHFDEMQQIVADYAK
ncbi:phosphotransferase [Paludicola sp. MB14-C6]|uniref:phosphotransferase enzyme family protein n=1 Tax=Paludihabitans sp. MB14-C6 TaxID=3070656 RepID=UPI0027DDECC0|nr:phosphotransferase [Paludicola sp. MB14-C6]WMJ23919.1 phosphotransferase [Paludicola sp. MB14-C6]